MKKTIAAFLCLFLFVSGCSQNTDDYISVLGEGAHADGEDKIEIEPPITNDPEPIKENKITLAMRKPKTLNPLLNEDVTVDNALKLIFEHVFVLNDKQEPVPNLAERIEFEANGLSATIYFRDDIYWSDGTKMTASDFTFTLSMIKNAAPATSIYKETVRNITNYSEISSNSVSITLNRPTGGMAYNLCFPIIPRHYYNNKTNPEAPENMEPVGNGAYIFEDYLNVQEMNLKSNGTYFKGRPAIEQVRVLITADMETDYYAFEQSITDVLTSDVLDWSRYSGTKETVITEFSTNYYDFIGFNFRNAVFTDKKVREAIAHCFNVDEMVDNVYLGHALRTRSVINPSSWAYEEDLVSYDYDKEMAKELLDLAGFSSENSTDGTMQMEIAGIKFELKLRLLVNEENPEKMKVAEILAENLEDIGVSVELIACDFETYLVKLRNGEFDLFVGSLYFSVWPDFAFAFNSNQIDLGSNYFNYRSETLDSYLSGAANARDQEELHQSLSEIQKHIAEELPCISIVFRKSALITDEKIKGEIVPALNNVYYNINNWYINKGEF